MRMRLVGGRVQMDFKVFATMVRLVHGALNSIPWRLHLTRCGEIAQVVAIEEDAMRLLATMRGEPETVESMVNPDRYEFVDPQEVELTRAGWNTKALQEDEP